MGKSNVVLLILCFCSNILFVKAADSLFTMNGGAGQTEVHPPFRKLVPGIYRTYEDFKYNRPSCNLSFHIDSALRTTGFKSITFFHLVADKDSLKKLGFIWGFCDGETIYKRAFGADHVFLNPFYSPVWYVGGICMYYDRKVHRIPVGSVEAQLGWIITINYSTLETIVIDLQTDKEFFIKKRKVRKLLSKDPELLDAYNKHPKNGKDSVMIKHIVHYDHSVPYDREQYWEDSVIFEDLITFGKELAGVNLTDKIDSIVSFSVHDTSFRSYYKRVLRYKAAEQIYDLRLQTKRYESGRIASIGLVCSHDMGALSTYYYKTGVWRFFDEEGNLTEIINYDINEKRHGYYMAFDPQGHNISRKHYYHNREVSDEQKSDKFCDIIYQLGKKID